MPIAGLPILVALFTNVHTPVVPTQVQVSERVRPIQPSASVAPPLPLDVKAFLSITSLIAAPRTEQIQILEQLIANTPDTDVEEKADYYYRLATLYAQMARVARTASDTRKATDNFLKSVKTFKALVDNDAFRNYPKLDTALFEFAYTLQAANYMKEARAAYDRLLKNFPNSKFVPEAHLAFGEYYFEQNQLADAEARYKQVLKFPKSQVYWFAMAKLGRIHYELQRFQEALEVAFQIVQGTKADAKQRTINEIALDDFVRAYAQIGKADKAKPAFQRVDASRAFDMQKSLAARYLATGKFENAIFEYRELMTTQPQNPDVCTWQYSIAHAFASTATPTQLVTEVENLVKLAVNLPALAGCAADAKLMSGQLGRAFHVEYTKTKNPATAAFAERLYASYLGAFATEPDAPQVFAFHAQTLWDLAETEPNQRVRGERWERAAEALAATPTPAVAAEAWSRALDLEAPVVDVAVAVKAGKAKARALTARETNLLASCDAAIRALMKTSRAGDTAALKLVEAVALRGADAFDRAAPILMDLLDHHRAFDRTELVANLLLEALIRAQEFDLALEVADKLRADAKLMANPEIAKAVEFVRSRSLRKN